jgi:hypothetical protein
MGRNRQTKFQSLLDDNLGVLLSGNRHDKIHAGKPSPAAGQGRASDHDAHRHAVFLRHANRVLDFRTLIELRLGIHASKHYLQRQRSLPRHNDRAPASRRILEMASVGRSSGKSAGEITADREIENSIGQRRNKLRRVSSGVRSPIAADPNLSQRP